MEILKVEESITTKKIAKVAIEGITYSMDKLYSYILPKEFENNIFVGQRVVVPFGKGNKKKVGLVLAIDSCCGEKGKCYFTQKGLAIKPILQVIDKQNIITKEMVKIIYWLKEHTFCRYFDAFKVMVPSGLSVTLFTKYKVTKKLTDEVYNTLDDCGKLLIDGFKSVANNCSKMACFTLEESLNKKQVICLKQLISEGLIVERNIFKRKINDQKSVMVKLAAGFLSNLSDVDIDYKLTLKQKKVVDFLLKAEVAAVKEVVYLCGVTKAVLDNLEKKDVITYFEQETFRTPYKTSSDVLYKEFDLNLEQKNILQKLIYLVTQNKPNISLLRGITGSGKTLIFISLIKYVISKNKQALLLVPEISLTPQMVNTLQQHFGSDIAVLHSGLTLSNRLDEWKRINNGEIKIVLGTRSAVFAPLKNIGVIIMDEEQEASYKSESAPRYNTKDVAKLRAVYNNALFLMASATPSVETYYYMKKNNFSILELNKRYNNVGLPEVSIVDMKKEHLNGNHSFFSEKLIMALEDNLLKNQQSIIFINRRGYNTIVKCSECGKVETCPNCSIALTYHKANNKLMCHYCGYVKDAVKKCTNCGSSYIQYGGVGTQKIEAQLEVVFPRAKILRLDSDTTVTRFAYDKYFKDFLEGKYQILIGTQMVAKGLNFPNVTLVGVIDGDQSIYSSDYKGIERTYDIITQVIGRSGRGKINGKAIVQTNAADNEIFELIANQKYDEFFNREILSRKRLIYPPFCNMSIIGIVGLNENTVLEVGNKIFKIITELIAVDFKDVPLTMFGPLPEMVLKVNGKFRYKIILKHKCNKRYRELIEVILSKALKFKGNVNIFVDKI